LSVSKNAYQVIFAATNEPCDGQHVCSWGSVIASDHRGGFATPAVHVQLASGLEGDFRKAERSAYCGEATLEWREDQYYYTIGIKAGTRDDLVKAVNSAIAIGRMKMTVQRSSRKS
jgi:hypothetical protein